MQPSLRHPVKGVMRMVDWVQVAVSLLTAGLFALIGFVWKWSHKSTRMEEDIDSLKQRVKKLEASHDKAMDKMYSIVKERSQFLNR
jgi:Na+(H+)/acetate symporter ActP